MHERSTRILEDRLYSISGLPLSDRQHVGSLAGNRVMNPSKSIRSHRAANYLTFGGVAMIIVIYTIYALLASERDGAQCFVWICSLIYVAIAVVVALSWIGSFKVVNS